MATKEYLCDISKTLQLSSHVIESNCQECNERMQTDRALDDRINHYIQKHSYLLLFIGSESDYDDRGNLVNSTIAILGRK